MRPSYTEVLDFTLPVVQDPELETLIDMRVDQLIRQLSSSSSPQSSIRGHLVVQFSEKKRRKIESGLGWFTRGVKGEEEVCWESWSLEVTLATPKTEIGIFSLERRDGRERWTNKRVERTKVTKAVGSSLQRTAMKILTIVNRDKDHIPPITTSETNPFPYSVELNPRVEGWGRGIGAL